MPHLFDPLQIRDLTLKNRVVVSPMCQYSSVDGLSNDWHYVHLASRAVGGAALVFTEAAAVAPEGRISPQDLGIWNDAQRPGLARIVEFIHSQKCAAGVQLAHAGRKASTVPPWQPAGRVAPDEGGWEPLGPSSEPFAPNYPTPRALSAREVRRIIDAFRSAAIRAAALGFDVAEIHAAHGYLIHEFLSPLTNTRADEYGGTFDNRIRLCLEVAAAVREAWPPSLPLFVRISATDWTEGGWDIDQSVELSRRLRALGVDLVDCSSGGNIAHASIPIAPGYQVPFAAQIRRDANILTGAVGLITAPTQADAIVERGEADCVLLAREMLRDPYWPLRAARELDRVAAWPTQYLRAAPGGSPPR